MQIPLPALYRILLATVIVINIVDAQVTQLLKVGESASSQGTAMCVLKLSAKYFVDKMALSGSIVIININSYSSTTHKTLLETIHSGTKYSIMVKDSAFKHKNASHFPEKAKNYMMILEDKTELQRNIHQLNKLPTWNPHAKAVVYLKLKEGDDEEKIVKELIDELRNYRLLRTIVFIDNINGTEMKTYTWKPYSRTNCAGPCDVINLLDTCKNKKIQEVTKLEDILPEDMNGCPLTVYTVVSEPYVMPPTKKIGDSIYPDEYSFDLGIEISLMRIISNITNMTLIVRMSDVEEDWGYLDTQGVATGLFAKLREEEVDIIIGNMEVNRNIRKWFDASSTYMQDDITWCVPKAAAASTWSNLITIFKWSTWVSTFSSVLGVSLILHTLNIWENKKQTYWPTKAILMTFGMILGWGSLFYPKSISFRIVLLTWLIFSININTSYQSFLRSFLIHPNFEKQIKTDDEIAKNNLKVGGRFTLRSYFETGDATNQYIYENFENCSIFSNCVKRVGFDRNFAVAGSKNMADFQDQKLGKGISRIYCYQEGNIIYKYGVAVIARKWFPMLNRFNGIIRSVTENGLILKWKNEVFLGGSSASDTNDMVPLSMGHMLGAFLFLLIGYGTCFTVFVLELLSHAMHTFVTKYKHHKFVLLFK